MNENNEQPDFGSATRGVKTPLESMSENHEQINPAKNARQAIRALSRFVRDMKGLPLNEQRAAIFWLADYFLGVKSPGQQQ